MTEQIINTYEYDPSERHAQHVLKASDLMGLPSRVTIESFCLVYRGDVDPDSVDDEDLEFDCYAIIAEMPDHALKVSVEQYWYINLVGPRVTLYPNGQHILLYGLVPC